MVAYVVLASCILLLVGGRFRLKGSKHYQSASFATFVFVNLFTVFWYLMQYRFLRREYGVIEADVSVQIIPEIFLGLFWVFLLNVTYNVLYVLLNRSRLR